MNLAGGMQYAEANAEPLRVCRHRLHYNSVIATQVAAMLLKRYKEKFSGNPLGATWGYLRQMARDSLPPNPLVSHDTQPSHLRDPAFLIKTLRYEPVTLRHELVTLTLVNPLKLPSTKLSQHVGTPVLCYDLLAELLQSCLLNIQRYSLQCCNTLDMMRLASMRNWQMQFDQFCSIAQQASSSGAGHSMVYKWYLCCGYHTQHDCLAKLWATAQLCELIIKDLSACSHVADNLCIGAAQAACNVSLQYTMQTCKPC